MGSGGDLLCVIVWGLVVTICGFFVGSGGGFLYGIVWGAWIEFDIGFCVGSGGELLCCVVW